MFLHIIACKYFSDFVSLPRMLSLIIIGRLHIHPIRPNGPLPTIVGMDDYFINTAMRKLTKGMLVRRVSVQRGATVSLML
jgi:hypothetical protein